MTVIAAVQVGIFLVAFVAGPYLLFRFDYLIPRDPDPATVVLPDDTPRVDLRVVYKDWPEASRPQRVRCREGGRLCPRCQAMLDAGVNPYTQLTEMHAR